MKPSAYIESSIPSYLAARPSANLLIAAHQQVTSVWWQTAREKYDLYVSEVLMTEIRQGNPEAAARRIAFVSDLPVLALNDEIRRLARLYRERAGLPEEAGADMAHVAMASFHKAHYLVTWNCAHIANRVVVRRLTEFNLAARRHMPLIVTPEDLLEPGWETQHDS